MNRPLPNSRESLETTVVRLVTEALRACGGSLEGCQTPVATKNVPKKPSETKVFEFPAPDHPMLSGVVSISALQALPKNTTVVGLAPAAIVTPAARDWLREHGIHIEHVAIEHVAKSMTASVIQAQVHQAALIMDVDSDQRAQAVSRQLILRGLPNQLGSLESITSHGAATAIVLADLPAFEVDRLARHHGLSAAAADSVDLVRRIQAKISPDVWVLDTVRLTISGLVSVAEVCLRGTPSRIAGART